MPISKEYISSPLEAGPSLLDIKQLPPQLLSALDYVSKRLARKRLHISLIVVRKDINIPGIPLAAPEPQTPSVTTSPAKSFFNNASSTFTRTLSKSSTQSPTADDCSSTSGTSRASLWQSQPTSPQSHSAASPTSPSSSVSSLPSPVSPAPPIHNQYGLSLIHMNTLTEKAEKILRTTIAKAEKKFPIG